MSTIADNGSGLESNPQSDPQPEETPQPQPQGEPQEPTQPIDSQADTVVDDVAIVNDAPVAKDADATEPERAEGEAGEPPTSPILKKRKNPHTLVDPRILNSPMNRSVRQRVRGPTAETDVYEPSSPTYSPTSPLKNSVPPLKGESEDDLEEPLPSVFPL